MAGQTERSDTVASTSLDVWCTADQCDVVGGVARRLRFMEVAVCGVDGTQTQALATALDLPGLDDPRQLGRFIGRPAGGVAWLAADVDLPAAALRSLADSRCPVLVSAIPTMDLALATGALRLAGTTRWALARPERAAMLRELGEVWSVHLELGAEPALGGLGWRLLDAVDLASATLERIESVSAGILDVGGRPQRAEGLRGLSGTCGALLRDRRGRLASISIGGRRGTRRRATLLGEHGALALDDHFLRWFDRTGRELDRLAVSDLGGETILVDEDEIARAILEAADGSDLGAGRQPTQASAEAIGQRLAICEALRVSAISGAAESVDSMIAALAAARL